MKNYFSEYLDYLPKKASAKAIDHILSRHTLDYLNQFQLNYMTKVIKNFRLEIDDIRQKLARGEKSYRAMQHQLADYMETELMKGLYRADKPVKAKKGDCFPLGTPRQEIIARIESVANFEQNIDIFLQNQFGSQIEMKSSRVINGFNYDLRAWVNLNDHDIGSGYPIGDNLNVVKEFGIVTYLLNIVDSTYDHHRNPLNNADFDYLLKEVTTSKQRSEYGKAGGKVVLEFHYSVPFPRSHRLSTGSHHLTDQLLNLATFCPWGLPPIRSRSPPPILSEPAIVDDGGQLKLKVTIADPVNGGVRSGLEPSNILQSVTIVDRTVISANYIANDEYSGTFEAIISGGQIVSTQNLLTKNPGSRVYVEMSDRVRNQGIRDFSGGCGAGCTPHPKP